MITLEVEASSFGGVKRTDTLAAEVKAVFGTLGVGRLDRKLLRGLDGRIMAGFSFACWLLTSCRAISTTDGRTNENNVFMWDNNHMLIDRFLLSKASIFAFTCRNSTVEFRYLFSSARYFASIAASCLAARPAEISASELRKSFFRCKSWFLSSSSRTASFNARISASD